MACHLFGAKPLFNPSWTVANWTIDRKIQLNLNQNKTIFIKKIGQKISFAKCWTFCLILIVLSDISSSPKKSAAPYLEALKLVFK